MHQKIEGAFFVIIKAPQGSGFNFTKSKAEEIEAMLLPELGKGEYRKLIMRVPGFGRSSKQVNSGFIIVLLEDWSKRKRHGVKILRESFAKIGRVPGVLHFLLCLKVLEQVELKVPFNL